MSNFHENLSPSKRHRWRACAASVREEAKYPAEEKSNPAAVGGTHTHTVLNKCIMDGIPAMFLIGMTLTDHEGDFVVTEEQAERVQFALDYIWERGKGHRVLSEERVDPQFLIGRRGLGGTVDVQIIGPDWIEIIDYKDGMADVPAKDNPQLEQYGFGVLAKFKSDYSSFKTVRTTIIQPKLRTKGLPGIDSHEMPLSEFLPKWEQIKKEADATDDPNAPFNPGEEQCKYCRHAGACTARAEAAMKSAGVSFAAIADPVEAAQQAADKEPSTMSDDQIRQLVEAAPLLRGLLDSAEEEALRRIKAGHTIEGLKLVRGRGSRAWAYDEGEMVEKLKKFGIPKADLFVTKLISPAQAEKLTWEKKGEKVALSPVQLKRMTEYVKKTEGSLTVAPESDSRPAVTTSVEGMFQPVVPSFLS